jgi:hypothetical protein
MKAVLESQATPAGTGPAQLPSAGGPLVGRAAELAALRDLLGRPGPAVAVIVGPPGVGKTAG